MDEVDGMDVVDRRASFKQKNGDRRIFPVSPFSAKIGLELGGCWCGFAGFVLQRIGDGVEDGFEGGLIGDGQIGEDLRSSVMPEALRPSINRL